MWQSCEHGDGISSIPRYVEVHAERLRRKYLAFIHDLAQTEISGKRVVDHFDMGDGFSLWWMTQLAEKSPFKSPRIYDCIRLMALEEMVVNISPFELVLFSSDRTLAQSMQRLCENLKIGFIWRRGVQPALHSLWVRMYRSLPHAVQGLISLRHIFRRWPLRRVTGPQWFQGANAIFICSYFIHLDPASCAKGVFYSRQWGKLQTHFNDSGRRFNWIHHFLFSEVVQSVNTALDWVSRFNSNASYQGNHRFLDTYLTWTNIGLVLKMWGKLNFVAWRLRGIPSAFCPVGSAVWLWPLLRSDWQTSLNGSAALNNCLWTTLFDAALRNVPHQPLGLYLCENQGWERALLRAWRKYGHGKIIAVQHATVPFWHLCYFDDPRTLKSEQPGAVPQPDVLAVNGLMAWTAFVDAGYPVERLAKVEALRYQDLARYVPCQATNHGRIPNGQDVQGVEIRIRVLVLGELAKTSMHHFLRILEGAFGSIADTHEFTFKPHPGYAVNMGDYPGITVNQTTEALEFILHKYDIALCANSTSAAVEAYVAGLPVIIGLDGSDFNLSPLRGRSDVRFVGSPDELADALHAIDRGYERRADHTEFFFLNPDLPRWNQLLSGERPFV